MKEELSGLIGELKNDVDDKGTKIEEDRKAQDTFSNYFFKFLLALKLHLSTGKPKRLLLKRLTMNLRKSGRSSRLKVFSCFFIRQKFLV